MRRPLARTLPALALALVAPAALSGCGLLGGEEADLQVYSARHYDLEEAFSEFTEETGLSVEFLYGDDAELLERLKAEGVVYDPEKVDPSEFDAEDTYAGLGDPRWKGRLCMRDETASYTQSLVASLIDLHGRERAQEIVESWVANDVQILSNDVELLETIASGGCEVGISNHYYLARMLAEDPDFGVDLYWASQEGAGTHVNISGAGIVAGSPSSARGPADGCWPPAGRGGRPRCW